MSFVILIIGHVAEIEWKKDLPSIGCPQQLDPQQGKPFNVGIQYLLCDSIFAVFSV